MSYVTFLVAIVCSNPVMHEKFNKEGSTDGLMVMKCEKALHECYQISGDIKHCIQALRENGNEQDKNIYRHAPIQSNGFKGQDY
jgi:ssRNA-specific RNase YbeY (16S rRNA maturation enzyme)